MADVLGRVPREELLRPQDLEIGERGRCPPSVGLMDQCERRCRLGKDEAAGHAAEVRGTRRGDAGGTGQGRGSAHLVRTTGVPDRAALLVVARIQRAGGRRVVGHVHRHARRRERGGGAETVHPEQPDQESEDEQRPEPRDRPGLRAGLVAGSKTPAAMGRAMALSRRRWRRRGMQLTTAFYAPDSMPQPKRWKLAAG
ncbi:hypothetical protein OG553_29995 [Streptomyces sp. NBC_00158]